MCFAVPFHPFRMKRGCTCMPNETVWAKLQVDTQLAPILFVCTFKTFIPKADFNLPNISKYELLIMTCNKECKINTFPFKTRYQQIQRAWLREQHNILLKPRSIIHANLGTTKLQHWPTQVSGNQEEYTLLQKKHDLDHLAMLRTASTLHARRGEEHTSISCMEGREEW